MITECVDHWLQMKLSIAIKASIGWHGKEKMRIIVSESSEGTQHSENFMGCTVCVYWCIIGKNFHYWIFMTIHYSMVLPGKKPNGLNQYF